MASESGTGGVLRALREDGGADAVRSCWDPVDADSNSVMYGIQNGRGGRDDCLFADAFRAEWADGRWIFDQDRFDGRHVSSGRDEVVVQVLALAGEEFFHERMAESLRGTAFNLAFDQCWIDGAAHVVSGCDLEDFDRAEFGVDFDFREVGAESVDRIRDALA